MTIQDSDLEEILIKSKDFNLYEEMYNYFATRTIMEPFKIFYKQLSEVGSGAFASVN